jgi:carbamoyl-phosphate synthase small subunit
MNPKINKEKKINTYSSMDKNNNARLILDNGDLFVGKSFGYTKSIAGELVFNTGMVGYPKTLTDPSYKGQILVLTYPIVGNYGVPEIKKNIYGIIKNFESEKIQISGLIIQDYSFEYSHYSAIKSLSEWLIENKIPALYDIDTRQLTKIIRTRGVMQAKIIFDDKKDIESYLETTNFVDIVSSKNINKYGNGQNKVLLINCGAKNSIKNELLKLDTSIIEVPWDYDFLDMEIDGVLLSNGPGDPKNCMILVDRIKKIIEKQIPIFGICLGNQILALASGADTYKLKFGHRSQNQPCMDLKTKKCFITSQNHGYAVDTKTLKVGWTEWFKNINDDTNEGIIHDSGLFFSVQFHPEANPGPIDTNYLFEYFIDNIKKNKFSQNLDFNSKTFIEVEKNAK